MLNNVSLYFVACNPLFVSTTFFCQAVVTFKPIFQLSAAKFFLTLVFGNFGANFDRFIRFLLVSFLIKDTAIELSLNVMSSVESTFKFAI